MKFFLLASLFSVTPFFAQDVQHHVLNVPPGMIRADLYSIRTVDSPSAVLLLCPGVNGSAKPWLHSEEWRSFARKEKLGLVGLSFASSKEHIHDGTGYYYAKNGSGETLLSGIRKIYGKELPLWVYGFSGGAHFTARLAEWKPEKIIVWCAYSAIWWDTPQDHPKSPPGLIVCGSLDERLGASLGYFKEGRTLNKPWTWLEVPNNKHSPDKNAEVFIRSYFQSIRNRRDTSMIFADIDHHIAVDSQFAKHLPSLTACFPDTRIYQKWRNFYEE